MKLTAVALLALPLIAVANPMVGLSTRGEVLDLPAVCRPKEGSKTWNKLPLTVQICEQQCKCHRNYSGKWEMKCKGTGGTGKSIIRDQCNCKGSPEGQYGQVQRCGLW